jgi:hypothetical protein
MKQTLSIVFVVLFLSLMIESTNGVKTQIKNGEKGVGLKTYKKATVQKKAIIPKALKLKTYGLTSQLSS